MNKKSILADRWDNIDKQLNKFIEIKKKTSKSRNNRIQLALNNLDISKNNYFSYASEGLLKNYIDYITEMKESNKGVFKGELEYLYNITTKRKRVKVQDILRTIILANYYIERYELEQKEETMFYYVGEITYNEVQREVKPRGKIDLFDIAIMYRILNTPNTLGLIWYDYINGEVSYNANEMLKRINLDIASQEKVKFDLSKQEYQILTEKQNKNYINYKDERNDFEKYSGILNAEASFLANQVALAGMIRQGVKEVIFVSVRDEKTTKICKSMDGQIFKIDGINRYSRANLQGNEVQYETKGLVVGENLPPLHYNCRSVIYPYKR